MKDTPTEISIKFGVSHPPLEEQLNEHGLTLGRKAEKCENLRKAIERLRICGIATKRESNLMYDRLIKMMASYMEEMKGE